MTLFIPVFIYFNQIFYVFLLGKYLLDLVYNYGDLGVELLFRVA